MRSGHSTWRPLCRTTERSWPSRTLPHRSSPPLLAIQWVGQVRNKPHCTSFLPHLFSTLLPFSLCLSVPLLLHLICAFISFLHCLFSCLFFHTLYTCLPPSPPPPRSFSPLSFHAYACWWISNDGPGSSSHPSDFKHSAFSTSSSPLTLLCSSLLVSNCVSLCNYFPMNISSLVKWQTQSACVCARASSWAHSPTLKRSDRQTAARGCQHSNLISPWWIEWKTCLILFFVLVPALIDLQQHWNQYRIQHFSTLLDPDTRCVFTRKALDNKTQHLFSFANLSVLMSLKGGLKCM